VIPTLHSDPIPLPYFNKLTDEYQISYDVIKFNEYTRDELLDKIATAINVKLYDNEDRLLFFAPIRFENWKSKNKLMLSGVNGCGKSRNIIEIVKSSSNDIRNIYI
jgi:hypothetical protein